MSGKSLEAVYHGMGLLSRVVKKTSNGVYHHFSGLSMNLKLTGNKDLLKQKRSHDRFKSPS